MKLEDSKILPTQEPAADGDSSPEKKPRKATRDAEGSIIKRTEERRTTGDKTRKVTVFYARVRYMDNEGKKREKKRRADSYNDAVIKRRELQEEIKKELAEKQENAEKPKTFDEVLDFFEEEFVKEAVFRNDQKIEGYKEDLTNIKYQIKLFRKAFGEKLITKITYDDIRRYKNDRLAEPVKIVYFERVLITDEERPLLNVNIRQKYKRVRKEKIKQREFASVNRELSRLRRIFNIAIRQGWLAVNPFSLGESLIQSSLETERLRICTLDEERRLLASCTGKREHFKAILIVALDTALRKSEIFRLRWKDVSFDERRIFVRATTAKTGKSRFVPMTSRVIEHLTPLAKDAGDETLVFGIETDSRTAWENAIEATGIEGLRFHDLRATAITRMLRAGMRESEVMKISGHSQYKTFLKYVRQDTLGTQTAADMMDSYLERLNEKPLGAAAPKR